MSSLRYNGALLLRALKVSSNILKSILCATGSQRSEAKRGEMCSLLLIPDNTLAAVF